jgi:hypothetical protein
MWAAGHTPDAWKESVTALLYKKGDHMHLSNFRRVGLEAALYKLYTKMTTCALIDYAERGGLLSINQWGFRPKRGTTQPLERLMYALEDIYLLMIDFTAAFDTIDQDKLLMTWASRRMLSRWCATCTRAPSPAFAPRGDRRPHSAWTGAPSRATVSAPSSLPYT